MLADAEYFNSRISKLEGAGDLGEQVVNMIRAKGVINDAKRSSMDKAPEETAPPVPAAGGTETM